MKLRITEILRRLKKGGINISQRTFAYYQSLGLLPKPEKQVGRGGRGVYGVYDESVIEIVKTIHELKSRGRTLSQIQDGMHKVVVQRVQTILKEWGFSDYTLPEMKGRYMPSDPEKFLRSALKDAGFSGKKVDEFTQDLAQANKTFENRFLTDLKWWTPDAVIEWWVVSYIAKEADASELGLTIALSELGNAEVQGSENEKKIIKKLAERLFARFRELQRIQCKAHVRLAQLSPEGEYKGHTAKEWKELQGHFE